MAKVYIAWTSYQRRAESLSQIYGLSLKYIHSSWEDRSALFKAISYVKKIYKTATFLLKQKPGILFIQLAPTPLLYISCFYRLFFRVKIIADCHNTMLYDDHWIKWPLAKKILRNVDLVLVHNNRVLDYTEKLKVKSFVLRDPIPKINILSTSFILKELGLENKMYFIIPCRFDADEPYETLFKAIEKFPQFKFVLTWYKNKFFAKHKLSVPQNLIFSGFLLEDDYNFLFKNSFGSLVLTTREGTQPSGASEAISLGVPLIMSDIDTTRDMYKNHTILISNTINGIVDGIQHLIDGRDVYVKETVLLREKLRKDYESEILMVQNYINNFSKVI